MDSKWRRTGSPKLDRTHDPALTETGRDETRRTGQGRRDGRKRDGTGRDRIGHNRTGQDRKRRIPGRRRRLKEQPSSIRVSDLSHAAEAEGTTRRAAPSDRKSVSDAGGARWPHRKSAAVTAATWPSADRGVNTGPRGLTGAPPTGISPRGLTGVSPVSALGDWPGYRRYHPSGTGRGIARISPRGLAGVSPVSSLGD